MTRKLFPCLYPLDEGDASSCSGAIPAFNNEQKDQQQLSVVINGNRSTHQNKLSITTSCCNHLTLNPKQQYSTVNGQDYLNSDKCHQNFPSYLAVGLFCCKYCGDKYATNGCLIRYTELSIMPKQESNLVVEYQASGQVVQSLFTLFYFLILLYNTLIL
jgi:hypothetical protein